MNWRIACWRRDTVFIVGSYWPLRRLAGRLQRIGSSPGDKRDLPQRIGENACSCQQSVSRQESQLQDYTETIGGYRVRGFPFVHEHVLAKLEYSAILDRLGQQCRFSVAAEKA